LTAEWENMLAHQLPQLPSISNVLARLASAIGWIEVPLPATVSAVAAPMPALRMGAGEVLVAPAGVSYWRDSDVLEQMRYAGANRLRVEFRYRHNDLRVVEPYSLRRPQTGTLLLLAHDVGANGIRSFKIADIRDLRVTRDSFVPRHRVEFLATGAISVGEAAPRAPYTFRMPRSRTRTRSYARTGPMYVFQCSYCQKEFRHSKNDSSLRRHRLPDGYGYCSSGRGYLLRVD